MKIAIEGMDGVGKSTLAKRIAKEFEFIYLEKPLTSLFQSDKFDSSEMLANISKRIYEFKDETIKAWFFGLGNIYSFLQYEDADLVIDRHFVSNYFWNGSPKTDDIFKNMINIIGIPDVTILLYADVETRLERIKKRDLNDYDLVDCEKHVFGYDKMIKFLDDFNIPYVLVDTIDKSEDDVFEEVKNIINNHMGLTNFKKIKNYK